MAKKRRPKPGKIRYRRSTEEMIEDLHTELKRLEQKAAEKRIRQSPEIKNVRAAVRALDRALKTTKEPSLKKAINEAKGLLNSHLQLEEAAPTKKKRGGRPNSAA